MHPAFSVIFFTTASGAGFGLLSWLGLLALGDGLPTRSETLALLFLGAVFAICGLLSSLLHLGQPLRAWRAFSQWRSSWLSREGVFSVATFVPLLWLGWLVFQSPVFGQNAGAALGFHYVGPVNLDVVPNTSVHIAGALLAFLALTSVVCTAMIYASLKPIPAWTHPLVLPVYLAFALFTGGLLLLAVTGLVGSDFGHGLAAPLVALGAVTLAALKWRAWRIVDTNRAPMSRNAALGLPHARPVNVFERPHTEANYLLKEMGYVLARRHARRLRLIALVLFALVPLLCALLALLFSQDNPGIAMTVAVVFALGGALVERWLFFAEARHLVTLYY